jgi:hypothetical protein
MNRTRANALWLTVMAMLLLGLFGLFKISGNLSQTILQQRAALQAGQQELENTSRLSTALAELDRLTINENTATRLEILRHLGLEKDDYDVTISGKIVHALGNATLTSRQVRVTANLPYVAALAMADKLYNNRKMNISGVSIGNANPKYPDAEVEMTVEGLLYGVEKRGVQ